MFDEVQQTGQAFLPQHQRDARLGLGDGIQLVSDLIGLEVEDAVFLEERQCRRGEDRLEHVRALLQRRAQVLRRRDGGRA